MILVKFLGNLEWIYTNIQKVTNFKSEIKIS